jgi:phosphoribosylglycinamide formyltransferase-1
MKKLCVFASGEGTNAAVIIRHFQTKGTAEVVLVVSNRKDAGITSVAPGLGVNVLVCNKENFNNPEGLTKVLTDSGIDLIILAGFLWLIPPCMIEAFPKKIINIHPALLPKFGGKGMFGSKVHQAVIASGEKESGITIHFVDEHYDSGSILLQKSCTVDPSETPESLALKVRTLEHHFYPLLIESLIAGK